MDYNKHRLLAYSSVALYIGLYYVWEIFFRSTKCFNFVANTLQTIPLLLTAVVLFYTYTKCNKKDYFWLLLSIGVAINFIGQLVIDYNEIFLNSYTPIRECVDIFWISSMIVFVIALFYKFNNNKRNKSATLLLIIDTMTIMCITTAVTWVYIFSPAIPKLEDVSLIEIITYIIYPIVDLGIVLGVIKLYLSLKEFSEEKKSIFIIIIAFFIMCIANSGYSYLRAIGSYTTGSLIDPLWSFYSLILCLGALEYRVSLVNNKNLIKNNSEYNNIIIKAGGFLPGISVILLLGFVTYKPSTVVWVCCAVSVILINIHQIIIDFQNKHLIKKLETLNETLESKVKERTEELFYMAFYDYLTNLPNKRRFEGQFRKVIGSSRENNIIALMFLDLDKFKLINDTFGHSYGDLLLKSVSKRINSCINKNSILYRQGGDEFAIVMDNVKDENQVKDTCKRILDELNKSIDLNGHIVHITCSIGIAIFPIHGEDYDTIMKNADTAMYFSKESGRNTYTFYSGKMDGLNFGKQSLLI